MVGALAFCQISILQINLWQEFDGNNRKIGLIEFSITVCLQNFLGFGQSAEIDVVFDGGDTRKLAEVKTEDGKKEKYLLYYDGETVSGKVSYSHIFLFTQNDYKELSSCEAYGIFVHNSTHKRISLYIFHRS